MCHTELVIPKNPDTAWQNFYLSDFFMKDDLWGETYISLITG
jgi:hypothetical protein